VTTNDVEPVAGPSRGNSHVMQMTSQLRLYSSQHLQPAVVCLPVSVQQLTYENDEFRDGDNNDDAGGDGSRANDRVLSHSTPAVSVCSASTLPSVTDSTTVCSYIEYYCIHLYLTKLYH